MQQSVAEDLVKPPRLSVEALLAAIRFLHDYVATPEGEARVKAAYDAGFVELVPGDQPEKIYLVPRFIWPDRFYDELYPGEGYSVSMGIQVARYMLWGPLGFFETAPNEHTIPPRGARGRPPLQAGKGALMTKRPLELGVVDDGFEP